MENFIVLKKKKKKKEKANERREFDKLEIPCKVVQQHLDAEVGSSRYTCTATIVQYTYEYCSYGGEGDSQNCIKKGSLPNRILKLSEN